jgi:hypothetical protein
LSIDRNDDGNDNGKGNRQATKHWSIKINWPPIMESLASAIGNTAAKQRPPSNDALARAIGSTAAKQRSIGK